MRECPFCKAPYEGTRNYAVEEIVREMKGNIEDNSDNSSSSGYEPESAVTHDVPDFNETSGSQPPPSEDNDYTASSSSSSDNFSDIVVVQSPRRSVSSF